MKVSNIFALMNREIKFRAWDNEGMRMVTENELGEYLWVFQNGEIKILAECETAREQGGETVFINDWQPIDAHIMQFTGLHDRNGKEVFEGDILRVGAKHGFNSDLLTEFKEENSLPSLNGIGTHFIGIVKIDLLRGLMFENPQNGYQEPMFTRHRDIKRNHSEIEIIGNIYENPELL